MTYITIKNAIKEARSNNVHTIYVSITMEQAANEINEGNLSKLGKSLGCNISIILAEKMAPKLVIKYKGI